MSAGNAAQGVALAARKAGVPCKILMIEEAPAAKFDAVRRLGGEVVKASYDQCWQALADRAHPAMTGVFIHPFEDDEFIAAMPRPASKSWRTYPTWIAWWRPSAVEAYRVESPPP